MRYEKLVRDRIPEIIEKSGERAVVRILSDTEYLACLHAKLDEEVAEYHESGMIEELADILEVVCALCKAGGDTLDALTRTFRKKHDERGGFANRFFLIEKESPNAEQNASTMHEW